ncbi:uncharacterized protein [Labrus bergylta]|uniref:uncharacterized protein isoform X1 n=1 Tax=Labrus bergylta TaxID=56723 RepID=UPI0033140B79
MERLLILLLSVSLLWGQTETGSETRTETGSETRVDLGQNITLNCSFTNQDCFWYMEVHSGFRSCISRTLASNHSIYFISDCKNKYTAMTGNRLLITNITADDYRRYFCGKQQNSDAVDTFLLVPDDPKAPPPPPPDGHQPQTHAWSLSLNELIMYISITLNILLVLVTGLLCKLLCLKKCCSEQVSEPSPFTPENPESPQYEEIQLNAHRAPPAADLSRDDIYSKAGFPQPTLRPQRHLTAT